MTPHQIVMASNLVWSGLALSCFVLFSLLLLRAKEFKQPQWLMLGVCCVSLGSAAHRIYWTVWRWLLDNGYAPAATWFLDHYSIPVSLVALIAGGYILHFRTMLHEYFGPSWVLFLAGYIVGLVALAYHL